MNFYNYLPLLIYYHRISLRIISGTAKGRKLSPPPKKLSSIRPTSDRAREALFQILGPLVKNAFILDLFAGTGALGIEALSRGADKVFFVDSNPLALKIIYQNIHHCFPGLVAELHSGNIILFKKNIRRGVSFLKSKINTHKFDLIFLDPPYEKKLAERTLIMVEKSNILRNRGIIVAEDRVRENLPDQIGNLRLSTTRKYGETGFWIYTHE